MINPQELEYIIDRIREIRQTVKELQLQIDNLGFYISDGRIDDERNIK